MPPGRGSKFAVLASPDHKDEPASNQQTKAGVNKAKNNKQKHKMKKASTETGKPPPQTIEKTAVKPNNAPSNLTCDRNTSNNRKEVKQSKKLQSSIESQSNTVPQHVSRHKLLDSRDSTTTHQKCEHTLTRTSSSSAIQNIFLWSVSACYLFAFVSFYYQIRGLYGDNGILPLRHYAASLAAPNETLTSDELFARTGSWIWIIAQTGGFSLTSATELLTLAGVAVSLLQLVCDRWRFVTNYVFLFIAYRSLAGVGQTFLHFQWDSFMLEVGALAAFASLRAASWTPDSRLLMWPCRWLFFRFMLSNGVVKLTSRCPLWWSLRTLDVHFESQCIPSPLAWYAHRLPTNWLHLATAFTFVLEIITPFLFLLPLRCAAYFSFISQALFQLAIIATGNYNFFNLLTISLSLSLLEPIQSGAHSEPTRKRANKALYLMGILLGIAAYFLIHLFAISFDQVSNVASFFSIGPSSRINFSVQQFEQFLAWCLRATIWLGLISLAHTSVQAIASSLRTGCLLQRFVRLLTTAVAIVICAGLFTISLVPLAQLHPDAQQLADLPKPLQRWFDSAQQAGIVSSYGLFRVMTGADGRPELIIEGNNDPQTQAWKPYHFRYKPGDLKAPLRYNIPHQPRLDWQMWFAALGNYRSQPWLINLSYRLLSGEPSVIALLDTRRLPFPLSSPPKYLRISRYLYKFTEHSSDIAWWREITNRHAYFPMVTKQSLEAVLKFDQIVESAWIQKLRSTERLAHGTLKTMLDSLHRLLVVDYQHLIEPHHLMLALLSIALLYRWTRRCKQTCSDCFASSNILNRANCS